MTPYVRRTAVDCCFVFESEISQISKERNLLSVPSKQTLQLLACSHLFWTETLQLIIAETGLPFPLPFRGNAAAAAAAEVSPETLRATSGDGSFLENRTDCCRFSSQLSDD